MSDEGRNNNKCVRFGEKITVVEGNEKSKPSLRVKSIK